MLFIVYNSSNFEVKCSAKTKSFNSIIVSLYPTEYACTSFLPLGTPFFNSNDVPVTIHSIAAPQQCGVASLASNLLQKRPLNLFLLTNSPVCDINSFIVIEPVIFILSPVPCSAIVLYSLAIVLYEL